MQICEVKVNEAPRALGILLQLLPFAHITFKASSILQDGASSLKAYFTSFYREAGVWGPGVLVKRYPFRYQHLSRCKYALDYCGSSCSTHG